MAGARGGGDWGKGDFSFPLCRPCFGHRLCLLQAVPHWCSTRTVACLQCERGLIPPPFPPPWSQPWVAVPYIAFLGLLNGWLAIYGEPFSLAALMFLMVRL